MWFLRSCPEPGGGSRSHGDTWQPRSCPAPGGGYHSTASSFAPFHGRSGRGAVPIRPPPPYSGCPPPPSTTSRTTTTLTSASKGYHLHVVLAGFYSSHSICAIMTLQLWGMSVLRILPLTYSLVSPSVVLPL
jgi:hypothetical protein